jgi:hypothetical protein
VARVLIVGGASRGLHLAVALVKDGLAVRFVTRDPTPCDRAETRGVEFRLGDPDRLTTLRGALEHVTIACWLLADRGGDRELVRALHGSRLEQFLSCAIDSTLRGFVYEAGGDAVPADVLDEGKRIVSETAARNSIPAALLTCDPTDLDSWLAQARATVASLLAGDHSGTLARYASSHIPKSRSVFDSEASTQEDG